MLILISGLLVIFLQPLRKLESRAIRIVYIDAAEVNLHLLDIMTFLAIVYGSVWGVYPSPARAETYVFLVHFIFGAWPRCGLLK